jgi:uncharacterized repeat protein (TIGR01451 family)
MARLKKHTWLGLGMVAVCSTCLVLSMERSVFGQLNKPDGSKDAKVTLPVQGAGRVLVTEPIAPPPPLPGGPLEVLPSVNPRPTPPSVPPPSPVAKPPVKETAAPPEFDTSRRIDLPTDIDMGGSENPTGRQEPAVSIEWQGPSAAKLGQMAGYQIIVKNITNVPVHQVIVRHRLFPGVKLITSEPRALNEANLLSWNIGTLQGGQSKKIDLQMLAEVRGALNYQATVTFTGASTFRVHIREPKLALKVSGPDKVVVGDSATLTLSVSNPGDGTAELVRVKAMLPEGLEHARGRNIEADLGNLASKETRTIQLVCHAKSGGVQKCNVIATADGNLNCADATNVEVLLPRIDLQVAGPKLRYIDRHAVYIFKVTNPGSAPASNVTITDMIPQGFKFAGASAGGKHDPSLRQVSWFVGDLTPGQSREVHLDLVAMHAGEYKHQAVVTANRGLKSEAEVHTKIEGLSALHLEVTDVDDPVEVGADTYYEVRVVNNGTRTESNVKLVCTLPDRMEFRGAKCAAGCRVRLEGREVVFEAVPRLAPRADVVYRIQVRGTGAGDLRLRARVLADNLAEPVFREETTKVYSDDVSFR